MYFESKVENMSMDSSFMINSIPKEDDNKSVISESVNYPAPIKKLQQLIGNQSINDKGDEISPIRNTQYRPKDSEKQREIDRLREKLKELDKVVNPSQISN